MASAKHCSRTKASEHALPRRHLSRYLTIKGEPFTYDGVDVCIYLDESGNGDIRVELIPEDEDETDPWPVDSLALSKAKRQAILKELR